MTDDFDPAADSAENYSLAIAALRMRAVMDGAPPRSDEPVDLLVMVAVAEGRSNQ